MHFKVELFYAKRLGVIILLSIRKCRDLSDENGFIYPCIIATLFLVFLRMRVARLGAGGR